MSGEKLTDGNLYLDIARAVLGGSVETKGDVMAGKRSWGSELEDGSRLLNEGRFCRGVAETGDRRREASLAGRGELGLDDVFRDV